ncbi:MAG: CapA family protein [Leptolyngbyaceae cyanobacterium CSU_1_3]|nr:CapA family protein [Leptolyngbyaceae cyanobacterium CSU_1_3]
MSYAGKDYQPSVMELARSGNFRAIAYWLNVFLLPHNLYARVEAAPQSGCLQVLVEFHPSPEHDAKSPEFRSSLVRFICHHLWKLNSEVIEGVQVIARFVGKPQVLWQQSVRVMSPARRAKLGRLPTRDRISADRLSSTQLRSRVQQVTRQKVQFRALRSLMLTGTTAAAFIIGCWLGYSDAPTEQTSASASSIALSSPLRPDTILTALGSLSVEKQEEVADPNDPTATLMFGGDVALTDAYTEQVGADQKWAFAALKEFREADVAMVNLESPFTTATTPLPDKEYNFKMNPSEVQVLSNGGVDIVNLANNHLMDYQTTGLTETLKTLDESGIHYVGAGRNTQEARRPEIIEVKGQRIAYLGYYDADFQAAGDTKGGTNARQNDRVAADIKAIRDQVDWVVVNYHWGVELAKYPTDAQIDLAHFTIDQGADLVVGHHPHVLQGAEIYKGRAIAYSLGNFIFGASARSDYDTAVLKVGLKDKQMKVEFLPVEVKDYQPQVVDGDRGTEILNQIENVSDIFQEPLRSPMVLDARSNTILSAPPKPTPAPAAPIDSPEPTHSEPQPDETPALDDAPQPFESGTPAPQTEAPSSTQPWKNDAFISAPSPMVAPDASPSPTIVAPDGIAPIQAAPDPTLTPGGTGIIETAPDATAPMPMVVPETTPAPSSEVPPNHQGDATIDSDHLEVAPSPKPLNSLEPIKKRYAESSSTSDSEVAAIFLTRE